MGKFYAVKKGKKTGIFSTWSECQEQVQGYPSAVFKSFKTQEDAENYMYHIAEPTSPLVPENDDVFVYYSLKKKDDYYVLAVGLQTVREKMYYVTKLQLNFDIFYTRLYAVLAALELVANEGYKNVKLFFDDISVHNYISREWNPLKGKNKEITTDYFNIFMLLTESKHMMVDFCVIPEHNDMHKRLQGIAKTKMSHNNVSLLDVKKQVVARTNFELA